MSATTTAATCRACGAAETIDPTCDPHADRGILRTADRAWTDPAGTIHAFGSVLLCADCADKVNRGPITASPADKSRPAFGACAWRSDCPGAALFSVKAGSDSGVCRYHRSVDDQSLGGYRVTWYHTLKVCGDCGAPSKWKQTRDNWTYFRCDAHKLPAVASEVPQATS